MKNEKITINSLLSWKDVIAFGDPKEELDSNIGIRVLSDCCVNKEDKEILKENINKEICIPFKEKIGDIDFDYDFGRIDYRFRFVKDENNKWKLEYSLPYILSSIYFELHDEEISEKYKHALNATLSEYESDEELKEAFLDGLKSLSDNYNKGIRMIREKKQEVLNSMPEELRNEVKVEVGGSLESYRNKKRIIRWFREHIDDIFAYFKNDYPITVLEPVNKDRFMLYLLTSACSIKEISSYFKRVIDIDELAKYLDNSRILSALNYSNNYKLLIDYINKENNSEYKTIMKITTNSKNENVKVESDDVLEEYVRMNNEIMQNDNYKSKVNYYNSYEELLENRATDTWNRIQNKKLIHNIKVNFDMIQSGNSYETISLTAYKGTYIDKDKIKARLKKDYDLLEEKMEYYSSKTPEINLVGINNFEGYFAQFYKNGCVVLDKFYRYKNDRKGNISKLPARNEAIYIMNHKEFANLCRCTKLELIEEIKKDNPNVERKYHIGNWQNKVDEIIDSDGYGNIDLEFIDELVKSLNGQEEPEEIIQYKKRI